jgi:hypothetical protein
MDVGMLMKSQGSVVEVLRVRMRLELMMSDG